MARWTCRTLVSRQLRFWLVHRPPGLPVRRPRVLLVRPPRARPRPSPQLRVLLVRKPPSSRPWQLLALPPWPLRARPCGRLYAPPSPPPRVARVRQLRSSSSLLPRASPAAHLRAGLYPRRQALLARLRLRDPWLLA